MIRTSLLWGSLFAASAVIIGAFGAHGLLAYLETNQITATQINSYETGVRYQMYHAFALLLTGILAKVFGESKSLKAAMWLFIVGVLFFSGSIYFLSTRGITGISAGFLGPVTPIGGLLFVAGWLCVFISFLRTKPN